MPDVGQDLGTSALIGVAGELYVRVLDSANRILELSRVARGCGLYGSRRWLQDEPTHDVWYLAAHDARSMLYGVLLVYLASGPVVAVVDSFDDLARFFRRRRPTLLGAGAPGTTSKRSLMPTWPRAIRRRVTAALTNGFGRLADA